MTAPTYPDTNTEQPDHASTVLPVIFSGKSGEFFKIWVTNVLFSVFTLGIYSAWAKVRTTQYFYGNTAIDGHRFRYLATPIQILKGRIIAVALFAAFTLLSYLSPVAGALLSLAFIFVTPWLLIQGIRFSLRMTSYRNVRFNFRGAYKDAFVTLILLPILALFTLYTIMPWVLKKIDQFIHSNITYGDKPVSLSTHTKTYYLAALAAFGGLLVMLIVMIVPVLILNFDSFATAIVVNSADATTTKPSPLSGLYTVLLLLGYWFAFTIIGSIYQAIIRNHLFAHMEIQDVTSFQSNVRVLPYTWLKISNALIILATLGLGFPITAIRKTRFLANATTLTPQQGANGVIDNLGETQSAFGEEAAEVFDVDFSLG